MVDLDSDYGGQNVFFFLIRIRLRIGILATTIPLVPYFLGKAKNLNNLSVTVVEAMVVLLVVEVALQL